MNPEDILLRETRIIEKDSYSYIVCTKAIKKAKATAIVVRAQHGRNLRNVDQMD